NLAGWFKRKQIALPKDKQLFDELVGRRWGMTSRGLIKVESKDEYKKRTGGKSPDRSDALALAFAGGQRYMRVDPTTPQEIIKQSEQIVARKEAVRPITADLQQRY
ncbi:MAG TPA: hypothetical protein VGB67_05030, partial [Fibrella sp.]